MDNLKANVQERNNNKTKASDKNNEEIESEFLNYDFKSLNLIHYNLFTNFENDSENGNDNDNANSIHLSIVNEPMILIENDEAEEEINVGKKLLGRKRKDSLTEGKHNKYSPDNLNRKIKGMVLNTLYHFTNSKIKKILKNEPDFDKKKDQLKKNEQSQIVNSNITFNKNFLNKTLEDIFSENISNKYKHYDLDHNKNLINKLMNDKNIKIRQFFHNLFSKTFLECLEHFRGTKNICELEGITTFDDIKEKFQNDPDYLASLEYKLNHYEEILKNQKGRKNRRNN